MKPNFRAAGGLLVACAALAGCKFSASASGSVKSSGDMAGSADASVSEQPAPEPPRDSSAITFREGRLDYEGVINFEYDKADLRSDAETQRTLAEFEKFLAAHPNVSIEIEGHTDSRGSDEYNRSLSERRAASVRRWLIEHGIAEDRVTSVGKGEDQPQVPEPDACNDKVPADTSPCEQAWAANRRVVFKVTKGAETLPEPEPPAATEPASVATPAPAPTNECPWLWGGHFNGLGPNSWVVLSGATQPGVCWLELSLGVGLGWRNLDAEAQNATGDGRYFSLTVPLRGRFWFMDRHSLIADAGLGVTHYRISADLEDGAGVKGEYRRRTTPLIGHLGIGYGFRPNGPRPGPRLALVVGGLLHLTGLGNSEIDVPAGFANAAALQAALDDESDELTDLEPYGEISVGWLF